MYKDYNIPFAISYSEVEYISLGLAAMGAVAVLGEVQSGKTNMLRVILESLNATMFDNISNTYIVDSDDGMLEEYKDKIPSNENKIVIKLFACVVFLAILAFVLKYVNDCDTFLKAFGYGFLLWTIVNLYDAIVLDIIWFCHDKHFVLKGTEDMVEEYHNYAFHLKGFLIGEGLALVICALAGLVVQFVL